MTSFARLAPTALAAPVLSMTSFATELATPSVTDERTLCTNTLPRLIYKDTLKNKLAMHNQPGYV